MNREPDRRLVSLETLVVLLLSLTAFPGLAEAGSRLAVLLARKNEAFGFLVRLLPSKEYHAYDHSIGLLTMLGTLVLILYLLAGIANRQRVQSWLLVLLLLVFLGLPTLYHVGVRYVGVLETTHDGGVLQTEAAIDLLVEGRNPYSEDYRGTDVERENRASEFWRNYPAIPIVHHLPYLPFALLSALPLKLGFEAIFGYYDQRFFYLIVTALTAWLLSRMASTAERKRLLVAAVLLNPYFAPFLLEGRNDILPFFLVVLSLRLVQQRRFGWSMAVMAMACATKQFAWVFLPFYALFLAGEEAGKIPPAVLVRRGLQGWRRYAVFLAVFCGLTLPFLLWNPSAFVDDVLLFNAGGSEFNYPLGGTPGYGAANLVLFFQFVTTRNDFFPFIIPILVAGVPLAFVLLHLQRRMNRASVMMAAGSVTLLVILFFSRLFHDNHLGLVLMWLTVAVLADDFAVPGASAPARESPRSASAPPART